MSPESIYEQEKRRRSQRWFLSIVAGMLAFLVISLCLAALILLRKGLQPMVAQIQGSSMEPHLRGPRLEWKHPETGYLSSYAIESLLPNTPLRCQRTSEIDLSFDLEQALQSREAIAPGEQVQYYLFSRVESRRRKAGKRDPKQKPTDFRGLYRGDLVVIQTPESPIREVKRIVGFPGEIVDIRDGDLWINGSAWKRDVKEILEQSILLEWGNQDTQSLLGYGEWYRDVARAECPIILGSSETPDSTSVDSATKYDSPETVTFRTADDQWISNNLRWNAHDSHELVEMSDFGVAIQIEDFSNQWQLSLTLHDRQSDWEATIESNGDTLTISTEQCVTTTQFSYEQTACWLVVMRVDGEAFVGSHEIEWLRETLSPGGEDPNLEPKLEPDSGPITISCLNGTLKIRQWLIFRDLYYRGTNDSASQRLEAMDGILVLGSNVSLSNDSRQRWPDGLPIQSIRGVVEPQLRGLDALLHQKLIN